VSILIFKLFNSSKKISFRITMILLGAAIVLLFTGLILFSFKQEVDSRKASANLHTSMIETSISRSFESLEISLTSIAETIDRPYSYDLELLEGKVERILSFAPHIRQIMVIKNQSIIFDSSHQNQSSVDFDRLNFVPDSSGFTALRFSSVLSQRFLPRVNDVEKLTGNRRILPVELNYDMRYNPGEYTILAAFNPSYLTNYVQGLELQEKQQVSITSLSGDRLLEFGDKRSLRAFNTRLIDKTLSSGANQSSGTIYYHQLPQSFYSVAISAKYPIAVSICFSYTQVLVNWIKVNAGFLSSMMTLILFLIAAVYILLSLQRRSLRMRQQIQLLSSTVEQSPIATIITDGNKAVNYLNPSFNNMFNNGAQSADSSSVLPRSQSEFNQVLSFIEQHNDDQAWSGSFEIDSIVANKRVFDATLFQVDNNITDRKHNIAMFFDATARTASQEHIKLLSRVVESSPVLVLVINEYGQVDYVNHTFEKASGYKSEEIVGKVPLFLNPSHVDISEYQSILQQVKSGKNWSGELQGQDKQGAICWLKVNLSPLMSSDNTISHYIAIAEIIDLQKENEKQRRLTDAVFRISSEAIMVTDKNNYIQLVNKSFERITGYSWEDCINKKPTILKSGRHDEKFYKDFYQQLVKTGHFEGEIWNKRKSGELYPQWVNISTMRDAKGDPEGYVTLFTDITKRKKNERLIQHQANYDSLTNLANRNLFSQTLDQVLLAAVDRESHGALLFIDLDHFKSINDTLGHSVGDLLLKEVAARIVENIHEHDTPARLGGDEFAIILPDIQSILAVSTVCQQLLDSIRRPYELEGNSVFVSCSIGVAIYPEDACSVEIICRNADSAMYKAKEEGRNCYHFYTEQMNNIAQQRRAMEIALHNALELDQLSLSFQPIWDIKLQRYSSAESLLRWYHPELGHVSPADFIPIAESIGLIESIGEWVIRRACQVVEQVNRNLDEPIKVNVNVSSRQFQRQEIVSIIESALAESGLAAQQLVVEVTESLLIDDSGKTYRQLKELHDMGIEIAIDDFGTGYSSLSYLKKFPISKLKIDQSFIADIETDPESLALVKTIISLSQNLKLQSVAEGVETQGQLALLTDMQCETIQGYYFSKPLPEKAFVEQFNGKAKAP
jgi:diguanylate cyclase (GGDEF)-like protein/PAS domain S-box-containing protein